MALHARQRIKLFRLIHSSLSVLASPIRRVRYFRLMATITECLDMTHTTETAIFMGIISMASRNKLLSMPIWFKLHLSRMAKKAIF